MFQAVKIDSAAVKLLVILITLRGEIDFRFQISGFKLLKLVMRWVLGSRETKSEIRNLKFEICNLKSI